VNYIEFRNRFIDLACFSVDQIYTWHPGFDRNNLTRWTGKGLLIRLRQGYYTFPEYRQKPDYPLWFANRIYKPSYVSLHSALSFYGIIPEAVLQKTSITSLKTNFFTNELGVYSYKSVKEKLMFGYFDKPLSDGRAFLIATPEKALLDLLYLYSFYDSSDEMKALRIDTDWLHDELQTRLIDEYLKVFNSEALSRRVKLLFKSYEI